jgi:hypothetical protein
MKREAYQLPMWLPIEAWEAYLEMRVKIRKPLTEHGKKLAITRLGRLVDEGHDATALLEESIFHCWLDFYPARHHMKGGNRATERTRNNLAAAGLKIQ